MSESTLQALRKKRDELAANLKTLLDSAKSTEGDETHNDFRLVDDALLPTELRGKEGAAKSEAVAAYWYEQHEELNGDEGLAARIETLEAAEKAAEEFEKREKQRKRRPMPAGSQKNEQKTLGQMITQHPSYKRLLDGLAAKDGDVIEGGAKVSITIPGVRLLAERKTLFQTTAGWAPESTRTGRVVPAVTRPPQLIDILPSVPTGQAAVVYMEETTRTHSATEINENQAYPESTFALTERTSNVRKIGTSIPVTDEQLADVPFAEGYLNERLPFGVEQRLDGQCWNGDGVAPNLEGILNVTGIQTQAQGADTDMEAMFKAQTNVRVTGRAMPTHNVLHSTDWQRIRLQQTADGIYLYGSPADAAPLRLWGLPVVLNEAGSAGTGLVGSFEISWIYLAERAGIVVEVGYVNDDFLDGRRTLRAGGRWAFVVGRPAAFCQVTGLS